MHTDLNWVVVCFTFVDTGDPAEVQLVERDPKVVAVRGKKLT